VEGDEANEASNKRGGEENFKLCRKTVGKFHFMPDKNFI
jgi:hypothetical protein